MVAVGTLAPAPLTGPGSWWPGFVAAGSGDGRHVALLQAEPDKWTGAEDAARIDERRLEYTSGRWKDDLLLDTFQPVLYVLNDQAHFHE